METTITGSLHFVESRIEITKKGTSYETYNSSGSLIHILDTHHVRSGILIHTLFNNMEREDFDEILSGQITEAFQKYGCYMLLTDISNLGAHCVNEFDNCMCHKVIPELRKYGLQSAALVLPSEMFNRLKIREWDKVVGGCYTRSFSDFFTSLMWLKLKD